jgi:hypothetical protein
MTEKSRLINPTIQVQPNDVIDKEVFCLENEKLTYVSFITKLRQFL